jgi:hypothetical protein
VDEVDGFAVRVVEVGPGEPPQPVQPVAVAGPHERPVRCRGEPVDAPGEPFGGLRGRIVAEPAQPVRQRPIDRGLRVEVVAP